MNEDFDSTEVDFEATLVEDTPLLNVKAQVEPTGDARVDAALDRLADLDALPSQEHVEVFDEIHRRLQDALADSHQ